MIKKTILMLLVLVGGVMQIQATDYIVAGAPEIANGISWSNNSETNKMQEITSGVYYLKVTSASLNTSGEYGFKIVESGKWTNSNCELFDSENDGNYNIKVTYEGVYDIVYILNTNSKKCDVFATPMLRSNIMNSGNGNWDWAYDTSSDFTQDDTDVLKWYYDIPSNSITADQNYFCIFTKLNSREFYPTISESVSFATEYSGDFGYDRGNRSWEFDKPTYSFSKIRLTLVYDFSSMSFKVTPDAFVSPTFKNDYATFSVNAPLNLEAANGFTAYYADANSLATNKVIMSKLTGIIAANTGLFLEKGTGDISVPVAASGEGKDYSNSNLLKHGGVSVTSDDNTYRYGFQTQAAGVGFYKITGSAIEVPADKAYLEIAASEVGNAPSLSIEIDGETTGIKLINWEDVDANNDGQIYDLQGRRVYQPTTGIYIKNGKKVIVK